MGGERKNCHCCNAFPFLIFHYFWTFKILKYLKQKVITNRKAASSSILHALHIFKTVMKDIVLAGSRLIV